MSALRILLAGDDLATRETLRAFLLRAGYAVTSAAGGREAIDAFRLERADVVMLDVAMPGVDGIAAASAIRLLAGERWVPLILLAAHTDEDAMQRALGAGADWTLTKPCSYAVVEARLDGVRSIIALRRELERKSRALEAFEERARQEMRLARRTLREFNRIDPRAALYLQHWVSPAIEFSGDTISAARSPDGTVWVMLADNVGHGLPAALNAIPVTRAFQAIAAKGLNPATMVRELNRTVRAHLADSSIVAATIARVSAADGVVEVWNGGNPRVLLLDATGAVAHAFVPHQPALGVREDSELDTRFETVRLSPGLQLVMASDGLLEIGRGGPFGESGLIAAFGEVPPAKRFGNVVSRLQEIMSGRPITHDVSLALVDCDAAAAGHRQELQVGD